MKRLIIGIVLTCLLVTVITPPIVSAEEALPLIDVNWFCVDNSAGSKSLNSDMEVWKELGVRNNMNIIIEAVPGSDFNQKFNLYLAGDSLPDVMQGGDIARYGLEGAFVALDDFIDSSAPSIKARLEESPALASALRASDGKTYMISEYRPFPTTDPNPLIRVDWLENVNLEKPQTLDEWYTVLKAFKENDPNGNGENDEIPYSGFFGGVGNFTEFFLACGAYPDFYPNEDGKYEYRYMLSNMKTCLEWLNKLYAEGLIDQDIASNDQTLFDQKFDSNTVGVFRGYFFTSMINKNKLAETTIDGLKLEAVPPVIGPDGKSHVMRTPVSLSNYGITVSAQDPERIVKLFDYMYSEDGILLTTMGIEGLTFEFTADGEPVYTDLILNNPEGMGAINALRTFGGLNGMPYIHTIPYRIGLYPENLRETALSTYEAHEAVADMNPITLAFTEDEVKENGTHMAEINTYVNEMILKFIYGRESLDGFDAFVENIEKLGIAEVVANYQAAYDRLQGNS